MFNVGDKVRKNPESPYVVKNFGLDDLYEVESIHMDFSFGMGPTRMYKIVHLKSGTRHKVGSNMIIYDINFLRKQKIEKICSNLGKK